MAKIAEGPLDFMKGAIGAGMAKSKHKGRAQLGKQALRKQAAKRFASKGGINRRKDKMSKAIFDKWKAQEADFLATGAQPGADEFNAFMNTFMAGKQFDPLTGSATDGNIRKNVAAAVERNFDPNTQATKVAKAAQAAKDKRQAALDKDQAAQDTKTDQAQKFALGKRTATGTQQTPAAPAEQKATQDAQAALKSLDHSDAEIQAIMKNAIANGADLTNIQDILRKGYKKTNTESIMYNKLMRKYLQETGQLLQNESNLHGQISRYIEDNGAQIEDWTDQAKLIGKWIRMHGGDPYGCKKPLKTQMGSYMYVFRFADTDGVQKWLAFDDDAGVADISDNEPDVGTYS